MSKFSLLLISIVFILNKRVASQYARDSEIERITEKIFTLSEPNLLPYIKVNLQGSTSSRSQLDNAALPLLTVNESVFETSPTIIKMLKLFDNYEIDASIKETVTPIEQSEENDFIAELLKTPIMKASMDFLQKKGIVNSDYQSRFNHLKTLWFGLYPRNHGEVGSCAFEHIFMSEMKYGKPIGLHNWIYYYHQESKRGKRHNVDYKGYMNDLRLGNKAEIIKYRMSFDGIQKPITSMFIATPPELDIALYTICFQMQFRDCPVSMNGKRFSIRSFPFYFQGKRMIGSAYPVI